MGKPETAVTDTHPLLFHAAGDGRSGHRSAALFERCERREVILYVPVAAIWETSLLARVRRVNLRRSVQVFFDDLLAVPADSQQIGVGVDDGVRTRDFRSHSPALYR